MRSVALALALALGTAAVGHAQREDGFCGLARVMGPHEPPVVTRARLREMLVASRSSLEGCIEYEGLRGAEVSVRVDQAGRVTVRARTLPRRDALAIECLAGNARDRIVRMIDGHDVPRPVSARLRLDRAE